MFGTLLLSAAAAAGILLVIWCVVGALLLPLAGRKAPATVLLPASGDGARLEHDVRGFQWLCDSGLVCGSVVVVDCGLDAQGRALAERLARERNVYFCTEPTLLAAWQEVQRHAGRI